jgi:hypothetical protein
VSNQIVGTDLGLLFADLAALAEGIPAGETVLGRLSTGMRADGASIGTSDDPGTLLVHHDANSMVLCGALKMGGIGTVRSNAR